MYRPSLTHQAAQQKKLLNLLEIKDRRNIWSLTSNVAGIGFLHALFHYCTSHAVSPRPRFGKLLALSTFCMYIVTCVSQKFTASVVIFCHQCFLFFYTKNDAIFGMDLSSLTHSSAEHFFPLKLFHQFISLLWLQEGSYRVFFCSVLLRCDLLAKKVPGRAPFSQHIIIRIWTKTNWSETE